MHKDSMISVDFASQLNPAQLEAVTKINGNLLIIAGAGSGKTRVITYRIIYLLEHDVPQQAILALTFTNKAAKEMQERVHNLLKSPLRALTICTFHAFGVRILRAYISRLGFRENFSIYDEGDKLSLIKESAKDIGLPLEVLDINETSVLISQIKTGRLTINDVGDAVRRLYTAYNEGLRLFNAVDFDDLIMLPLRLLSENNDILQEYRKRYLHIMVDEFQDTSRQQYELLRLIAGKNNTLNSSIEPISSYSQRIIEHVPKSNATSVAVVGDDDQSIYSWRGADFTNITNYEKDFMPVQEIFLQQNYRSSETILQVANNLISHNVSRKKKELWSGKVSDTKIQIYIAPSESEEAAFIANTISHLSITMSRPLKDFAILMRSKEQSRAIEEALLGANLPYTMSGGTSFFARKEVKDCISYLRVVANHDDDINLLRIINTPHRGVGRSTIESLNNKSRDMQISLWQAMEALYNADSDNTLLDIDDLYDATLSPNDTTNLRGFMQFIHAQHSRLLNAKGLSGKVKDMLDKLGYYDYILKENIKSEKAARFKTLNVEFLLKSMDMWENNPNNEGATLFDYLNRITLLSRDNIDDSEDASRINLMTIHAAKGLEFPIVFIAGVEEDLLPHRRAIEDDETNVEEERRLFYVAITRAKEQLYISTCQKRHRLQSTVDCLPSRFLDEIPISLCQYITPTSDAPREKVRSTFASMARMFGKL